MSLFELKTNKEKTIKSGLLTILAIIILAFGISVTNQSAGPYTAVLSENSTKIVPGKGLLNRTAKARAEKIISSFENSTTQIKYDYAQNINDGRGITAGRAGFTSGTSDLLMVVNEYEKNTTNPANALVKYIVPLQTVNKSSSTVGLEGFEAAWAETSRTDPALNKAQDKIYDKLYFDPAIRRASHTGIQSALGQLIILDTIVQQGEGNDKDGLPEIIQETNNATNHDKVTEAAWLSKFLDIRQYHLQHAADANTADAWSDSVSRVKALRSILQSGNLDLNPPLHWKVYGDSFTLDS